MLTISKLSTIPCLLYLCEGIGNTIPWQLSNQIGKLFFQMIIQIYSVPGQTEGTWNVFLEWTSIDLSSKLSLTCGGNVNYYKSVHHAILTLGIGQGTPRQFSKQISNHSFHLSIQVCSLLGQSKEGQEGFFGEYKQEGQILRLHPRVLGCHNR